MIKVTLLNKRRGINSCLIIVIYTVKNGILLRRSTTRSTRPTLSHTAKTFQRLPFHYAPSKQGVVFRQFLLPPFILCCMSELMFQCKNRRRHPPSLPIIISTWSCIDIFSVVVSVKCLILLQHVWPVCISQSLVTMSLSHLALLSVTTRLDGAVRNYLTNQPINQITPWSRDFFWESNSASSSQEISHSLWKSKVHHRDHKSLIATWAKWIQIVILSTVC